MKKIFKLMLIAGFIGFLLPSCDLDRFPTNAVPFDESFRTVEDARNQLNGLYSQFRTRFYGIFAQSTEVMSDLFNAVIPPGAGNIAGALHRIDMTMLGSSDIASVWRLSYSAINNANIFLERVHEIELRTPADSSTIRDFIGQAHYIRAHLYYILITHFGVAYTSQGGPEAPGVPLVTRFDLDYRPERATVGETYQFIMAELDSAYRRIATQGQSRSIRITRDAVKALRSKVQLEMGDNEGAAKTALYLINSDRYPLVTTAEELLDGWRNDNWTEDILLMNVTGTESANFQDFFSRFNAGTASPGSPGQHFAPFFVPTQTVIDLFEPNDLRRQVYLSNPMVDRVFSNGMPREGVVFLRKWRMNDNYAPAPGNYQHKPKVHRIAEQYLIAAEALGPTAEGIGILTRLRTARGATIPVDANNFTQILRDEWVREMIGEGRRIQSLKRWGIGFDGRVPQNPNIIAGGDMQEYYTLLEAPANFYRFTWPVPLNEIRTNPNIRQTPEWDTGVQ